MSSHTTNKKISMTLSRSWSLRAMTQTPNTKNSKKIKCVPWTCWQHTTSRRQTARRTKTKSVTCSPKPRCCTLLLTK
ncbi:hypothetical protein G9C98_003422 [Cotesia typhae]|uniref:Uncharacterized protein n=1 Tax=Cotesia typhae TaxID=2053667 RepID=A0A8J5R1Q5_9HYME|nr:hypothetical protein G9C98_003422 [Cotesia typhae]